MTLANAEIEQFYIPASRHAFIKKVQAGLAQSKIVAIEGQQGIGKTILIEEVLTQTSPDGNKCYVTAARSINDIQVRSRIIEQLFGNVLFDPEMPLLTSFIEFNNDSQMLIAIDNAHFLTGKIIGELLQLYSESRNLGIKLKLVLAFDKTIASTLINVKSGLVEVLPVPTLTKQESYQLLAQYVIDIPAQTNTRIKRWIENSAGLPIQLLAYNDVAEQKGMESEPFNIKLWVSLLVTASLLLALGIYLYRMGIVTEQPVGPNSTASSINVDVVKPWQNVTQSNAALGQTNTDSNKTPELNTGQKKMAKVVIRPTASSEQIFSELMNPSKVNQQVDQNPTTNLILAELTKQPETANSEAANRPNSTLTSTQTLLQQPQNIADTYPTSDLNTKGETEVQNDSPENLLKEQQKTTKDIELDDAETGAETPINMDFFLTPPKKVEDKPKKQSSTFEQAPQSELNKTESANKTQVETNNTERPDISRIDSEPTLEQLIKDDIISAEQEQPSAEEPGKPYRIDNQQFFSLPQDLWVLQLTAVSSEPVLAKYLASAPYDIKEIKIYKIRRNNSDWFVVTYGLFDTIDEARKTAASIAPNAWAKSISVIQQQILAFDDAKSAQ